LRLPPLNALKAFEAAARHGSFVHAAEELHISAGAISRHVKILENYLDKPLFRRHSQGVSPTSAALKLLPIVSSSFEMISNASLEIANSKPEIRVMVSPTLANRWLVPRLPSFRKLAPEIIISIGVLQARLQEFTNSNYDCAIATFYQPDWPEDLKIERVKHEELTPLCSPSLLDGPNPIAQPDDLRSQTLLHIVACAHDWSNWLEMNESSYVVDITKGLSFETAELTIRAAVEGLGITLMDRFLVEQELRSGELIDLFLNTRHLDNGYYFLCKRNRWEEPAIKEFRHWLHSELDMESKFRSNN